MLTRRRFLALGLTSVAAALVAGCTSAVRSVMPSTSPSSMPATPSPVPTMSPTPQVTPSPTPTATATAAGMSLRERIGQMLLVGFRGLTVDQAEPIRDQIADGSVGGVILFSVDQPTGGVRNIASPDQLAALVGGLKSAAPTPLMVAVDEEGGKVARLGPANGFPATQSEEELGRKSVAAVSDAAGKMARTLASVGITLNLAPVVDLAINPNNPVIAAVDRSFSADPAVVISHAAAFIEAHHAAAVNSAIKHFPGQGSATGDTHVGVVDVTDEWNRIELEPFRVLVSRGLPDAVLTAHIFNAKLDPQRPATLSKATVTGILREELGWQGVVISDDMQMGAIRDAYGYEESVALAIEAGIDVLLFANQIAYESDIVPRTIDLIEGLVRAGRLSEERINASVERVLAMKRHYR